MDFWIDVDLEPGGYLQWKEGDIGHRALIKADDSLSTEYVDQLLGFLDRTDGRGTE